MSLAILLVLVSSCKVVAGGGVWVPVGGMAPTRTLADGTLVKDCFDLRTGVRVHAEEWIERNVWKKACDNGTIEIVGCVASRRADFQVMKLNETVVVNGFWHKCEVLPRQLVRYSEEPSCLINGQDLHVNDTFRLGTFKMSCQTWGYDIVGCYYYDRQGELHELAVGTSEEESLGGVPLLLHSCNSSAANPTRVSYVYKALACEKDGVVYEEGATWIKGSLRYECFEKGVYTVIACVLADGRELQLGEDLVEGNTVHRCYRLGRTTYYHSYACGFGGVSCEPTALPNVTTTLVRHESTSRVAPRVSVGGGAQPLLVGQPFVLPLGLNAQLPSVAATSHNRIVRRRRHTTSHAL